MWFYFRIFYFDFLYFCGINKKTVASIIVQTYNLFYDSVKLIEYIVSAVTVVTCNSHVGPSTITKIIILSICTDELLSTPKLIKFLPNQN